MRTIRRVPFTLLEILLVLSLIALIAGLVGISVHKMYISQRFRNEVSLVVDQLRLAQDMMLILDTDVHVIFSEDKAGNYNTIKIESETKLRVDVVDFDVDANLVIVPVQAFGAVGS